MSLLRRCSWIVVAGALAGCDSTESNPPDPSSPSPTYGDACEGASVVCAGDSRRVMVCADGELEGGLACPVGTDEGEGASCVEGADHEADDPGVPACIFEFGRAVYFGLEGGSCTATESLRACTVDPRRFLTCQGGLLRDPCPSGFALDVDCAEVEATEPPSNRELECVEAGQTCVEEGRYQCITGKGAFRCEGGVLVASDACGAAASECEEQAPFTHVVCGGAPRAEAGKPCAPTEAATCSGDDADLLACVEGVWVASACPSRCVRPVEFDPPRCE